MTDMTLERAVQISRIILSNDVTYRVSDYERRQAYRVLADLKLPAEGEQKGLPVAGYAETQSQAKIDFVNEGKQLEERVLRYIDILHRQEQAVDQRFVSIGMTDIQMGFMALFRSVFQPQRIELPGDHNEPVTLIPGEAE